MTTLQGLALHWCCARVSLGDCGTSLSPHFSTGPCMGQNRLLLTPVTDLLQEQRISQAEAECPACSLHPGSTLRGSGSHFPRLHTDGAAKQSLQGGCRKHKRHALCQGPEKCAALLVKTCSNNTPPPRPAKPFKINFYKQFQNELILSSSETGCPLLTQHRSLCQTETLKMGNESSPGKNKPRLLPGEGMSRQDAWAATCHFPWLHKTLSESCSVLICGYTLAESTKRG